ncbi:tryptophan-rich antigen [Plasmodium gonderi]|uniref:Tryptophan-rich antigen n=1 Tax=Plasmodium gonderi TaxID=77519 RepID=A0A1Y1JVG6_PLAGO|nr:tryptophan-rich antigen [Plasmodium gonderi]GAW84722.1 tryptophan-rich antigen [Plasmodium gonderi]
MGSENELDNIVGEESSSFSALEVPKGDILFCVNKSFLKTCAHLSFLIFSIYIILKHTFPTVFKKLNNTLDNNTLNAIISGQVYLDNSDEKENTVLQNGIGGKFNYSLSNIYTNDNEKKYGGEYIPLEEETVNDKEKENDKKCEDVKKKYNNEIKELEQNIENVSINRKIENNIDKNILGKETGYNKVDERIKNNKSETNDNNSKEEEEKYYFLQENDNMEMNPGKASYFEKIETHIYRINEEDEVLDNDIKDDDVLKEGNGDIKNKKGHILNTKNITLDIEKGGKESINKNEKEDEKYVHESVLLYNQIKNEVHDNEAQSTSINIKKVDGDNNENRKTNSNSQEAAQEINKKRVNKYKLKEHEENTQNNSTEDVSKMDEKDYNKTVINDDKKDAGAKKVQKEIIREKVDAKKGEIKKEDVKKDETKKEDVKKGEIKKEDVKKEEIKKDDVKKEEIKKDDVKKGEIKKEDVKKEGIKKGAIKKDDVKKEAIKDIKDPKKEIRSEKDKKKDIRRAISLDTIYKSEYDVNDDDSDDGKSDEWKKKEWDNWLIKTEEDWKLFNTSIENKKNRWLEKREKELEQWLVNMQNKWMNFKENDDTEFKVYAMKNASTWNDSEWEQWTKTDGKKHMETDLNKWFNEKETFLEGWVSKEWNQWKNERMIQWLSVDWKHKEDETFENWKSTKFTHILHLKKNKRWNKWKERTNKEKEDWANWVKGKEKLYINNKWDKWSKWKKDRRVLYNQKFVSFINKWINDKQWTVWIKDQNGQAL